MKNDAFSDHLIIIGGPTASGKTRLAIDTALFLQKEFGLGTEIINADSIQIYRDLKILTAYPFINELKQVKHNLFGILEANELFNVALWLEKANVHINRIQKEGKVAILCGGTGFYIKAITEGISDIPKIPDDFRKSVFAKFNEMGRDAFFEELSIMDLSSYKTLNKNDTQRILRAYEIAAFTGKSLSEWWKVPRKTNYNTLSFILLPDKDKIRISSEIRISEMIRKGAIEEVREFNKRYPNYKGPLRNVIGYKEISENISMDELIPSISIRTRQYIKRQSTWFRNQMKDKDTKFLYGFGNDEKILSEVCYSLINYPKNI